MVYTAEQLQWIEENLNVGVFRNQKHFVDVFNALFNENVSQHAMASLICKKGWHLITAQNASKWTAEMDEWLKEHYSEYEYDFVYMARDFNSRFCSNKSAGCIRRHLEKMGIHRSRKNQKGKSGRRAELPVGTIRYNNNGRPYIKVMLCDGEGGRSKCHSFREPYWKSLQKKIWEDHYGEVPEGYVVCSLNGNPADTDINHIGIINKRGTTLMVHNEWWDIDNVTMMKTAVRWCNLACIVKESEGRTK